LERCHFQGMLGYVLCRGFPVLDARERFVESRRFLFRMGVAWLVSPAPAGERRSVA
jgi:hypothetical protein